jgi:ABC-type branched-subunit amino acid transport system permease subunit
MLRISIGTATVNLTESLTINAAGFPLFIYGIMLVGFIIFLPKGIVGGLSDLLSKKEDKSFNIKSSNVK